MKIMHVSDNHSKLPELLGDFDIVLSSGDFFPNSKFEPNHTPFDRQREREFQTNWLRSKANDIKKWLKGKPLLFVNGNHDFVNLDTLSILKNKGIEVIDLNNKLTEYNGYTLYGLPYIPAIRGGWNYECEPPQLRREVQIFLDRLKEAEKFNSLDILVAHCPPYGILDEGHKQEHIGNRFMMNALCYQLTHRPKLYLTGHAHEGWGVMEHAWETFDFGSTLFSNAAIGNYGAPRIVEI